MCDHTNESSGAAVSCVDLMLSTFTCNVLGIKPRLVTFS